MIDSWGIRSRVILVAILPLLVLALLLTSFYTTARLADLEEAYHARGQAFARQLVAASEYAVFSGNRESLQQLTNAVLTEGGVSSVAVVNRQGIALARSGDARSLTREELERAHDLWMQVDGGILRIVEPIIPSRLELDEDLTTIPFDRPDAAAESPILGFVVLELSRQQLDARRDELRHTGVVTILLVLMGTLMLAVSMSRGVTGPIRQVAVTVKRIGLGRFDERVPIVGGGSLRSLAEGVNDMAAELASMHEDMHARIDEATAALRTRKEEAEFANTSKSRFLAAASHDLRQPMHALGLFIAELSQQTLDERSAHLVHQISASAEAMEDLLDSLLDISKLDAGILQPDIQPFELQPLFNRIEASLKPVARERRLGLKLRPTRACAISDPVMLERILTNLVSNAVRHTRSGRILVACRRRGDRIRIEVRDTGVGIPQEARAIIFQEFVQLNNPERNRDKGLGLGLAIVRRLTDLLAHPLYLESTPGRGSLFALEVPACSAEAMPVGRSAEQRREPGDLVGLHLAVIDDDPLACTAIQSLLTSWGCEVTAAADANRLMLALTECRPPDIVIIDLRLGKEATGLEAIDRLRQRYGADLPAALITGNTAPDSLDAARLAALPLLHKPVRPARLRALLNRISSRADE